MLQRDEIWHGVEKRIMFREENWDDKDEDVEKQVQRVVDCQSLQQVNKVLLKVKKLLELEFKFHFTIATTS